MAVSEVRSESLMKAVIGPDGTTVVGTIFNSPEESKALLAEEAEFAGIYAKLLRASYGLVFLSSALLVARGVMGRNKGQIATGLAGMSAGYFLGNRDNRFDGQVLQSGLASEAIDDEIREKAKSAPQQFPPSNLELIV